MAERRKYRREEVFVDAEISCPDFGKSIMQVRDLGMGGIYLEADDGRFPAVGTEVDVTLLVHMGGEDIHTLKSRVTRVDADGIALKFLNVDVRYLSFLERLLDYKATKIIVA